MYLSMIDTTTSSTGACTPGNFKKGFPMDLMLTNHNSIAYTLELK